MTPLYTPQFEVYLALFVPERVRRINVRVFEFRPAKLKKRAGATPRTFWAAGSPKSGVAPARFCSLNPAAFGPSSLYRGVFQSFATPLGEDLGTGRCAV